MAGLPLVWSCLLQAGLGGLAVLLFVDVWLVDDDLSEGIYSR